MESVVKCVVVLSWSVIGEQQKIGATRKRGTQKNRRLIAQVLKLGFIVLQRVIPYTISNTGRSPSKVKPGWNDYCKEKRDIAMYWHEE